MCKLINHSWLSRYKSRSGVLADRYRLIRTEWAKLYPSYRVSARIVRLVLIFIPHLSLSSSQLYHHCSTKSFVIPFYLSMSWSQLDTEYSVHHFQHPPTNVDLPFILMITTWRLNLPSALCVPPYMIDCHWPGLHESPNVMSPGHNPTVASKITDE